MNPAPIGNVVKDFKVGETRIKICDDCCVKTKAEADAILERIAEIVLPELIAAERRRAEQK